MRYPFICLWVYALSIISCFPAYAEDSQQDIAKLIEQLGDRDFEVRERATKELEKIGEAALPQLRRAANGQNLERAWRAREIIKNITKEEPPEQEAEEWYGEFDFKGPGFQFKLRISPLLYKFFKELPEKLEKYEKNKNWERIPEELLRDLPPEVQSRLRQMEKQIEEFLSRYYRAEDRWRKEWHSFDLEKEVKKSLRGLDFDLFGEKKAIYGVRFGPVGEVIRSQFQLAEKEGLVVTEIVDSSKILAKRLEPWDLLLEINDSTIDSIDAVREQMEKIPAGGKVELKLIRRGKTLLTTIYK